MHWLFRLMANSSVERKTSLSWIPFAAGEQATVWEKVGADYEQRLLTWADGSRVVGRVVGNTDSGYALISLS